MSPQRCSMTVAITLLLALAGCGSDAAVRPPLARDIGPAPSYLQPVAEPAPSAGRSAFVDAKSLRHGLRRANTVITCAREDWERTRERLLNARPDEPIQAEPACVKPAPRQR